MSSETANKPCYWCKWSLQRLCFYTCLSVILFTGGGGIPPCLAAGLQGVYPSMPCRFPGPHPRESLRGLTFGGLQAHTQGGIWGVWPGGSPGPHPGGKLRVWPWSLQAHTQVVSQHALRQTPHQLTATAVGGTHPTGMHSCCNYTGSPLKWVRLRVLATASILVFQKRTLLIDIKVKKVQLQGVPLITSKFLWIKLLVIISGTHADLANFHGVQLWICAQMALLCT